MICTFPFTCEFKGAYIKVCIFPNLSKIVTNTFQNTFLLYLILLNSDLEMAEFIASCYSKMQPMNCHGIHSDSLLDWISVEK